MNIVVKKHKMNKKAWTISWAEMISLFLLLVFLVTAGPGIYSGFKKMIVKEPDAEAKQQLEKLIEYINADIDNIKKSEQRYPIDIDGTKYSLVAKNCETDNEGKCKSRSKTQLCLKRVDIDARDYCLKRYLDFAIVDPVNPVTVDGKTEIFIRSKNFLIGWERENNKLGISSS